MPKVPTRAQVGNPFRVLKYSMNGTCTNTDAASQNLWNRTCDSGIAISGSSVGTMPSTFTSQLFNLSPGLAAAAAPAAAAFSPLGGFALP